MRKAELIKSETLKKSAPSRRRCRIESLGGFMDYKTAGVDVEAGRAFVERIRRSVESTHRPEVVGGLGGFGGMMRLPEGLRQPLLISGTDGVGTKLELAQDHQQHHGVGIDLVAMCVNDVITSEQHRCSFRLHGHRIADAGSHG